MDELAIKIEHVSKQYRLGAIGGGTLTADLQSWWARKRGREDPNSKIGARTDIKIGEKFLALDDINLEVKKGEALGIIGHNGAGKSTLLKLLSRVTAPTTGSISYNGRITSMLEVGTGFHGELTGRENIYMNGAILGMTKKEIESKMEQIIDFSEVRQFIDTPVKRYSSGMYVKLAFSVAAHLDSEIMVMDEVLAVGDMKFQQKCLGRMGDAANNEGRTVLYVSHNMNTIRQLCQRCIVLDHGKVIFDGDTEKAIAIYADKNNTMQLAYQFSEERSFTDIDDLLRIRRISFCGKEKSPVYSPEEHIKLQFDYCAKKEAKNIALRTIISTPDGVRIGMATTRPIIMAKEGTNHLSIEFSPSRIAPGKYTMNFVLYSVNDYGTERLHDRISSTCTFEVSIEAGEINNLGWGTSTWGYLMMPEIMVSDSSE